MHPPLSCCRKPLRSSTKSCCHAWRARARGLRWGMAGYQASRRVEALSSPTAFIIFFFVTPNSARWSSCRHRDNFSSEQNRALVDEI
ncbi:MAG: hypothetical protein ACH346_06865 [Chthoniobacterales bacterium]